MKKLAMAVILGSMLAACSDDNGGEEGKAAAFAGLYSQSDGDDWALILDSGDYYLVTNESFFGHGTLTPGTGRAFSSADLKLFVTGSAPTTATGSLSGTYVEGESASVEIDQTGLGSDPLPSSIEFDEFSSARIPTANLADNWDGSLAFSSGDDVLRIYLTINTSGDIATVAAPVAAEPVVTEPVVAEPVTAEPVDVVAEEAKSTTASCTVSGKLTPIKGGYSLRMSFGAAPCGMAGQTVEGHAFTAAEEDALVGMLINAGQTESAMLVIYTEGSRR